MPLRITHVDTKVLVFLVQAMPTSLHAAPRDPVGKKAARRATGARRKAGKKKTGIMKLFPATVRRRNIPGAEPRLQKKAFLMEMTVKKTRAGVKYLQVKVPPSARSIARLARLHLRVRTEETGETHRASCCSQWEGWRALTVSSPLRTDSV